MCGGDTKVVMIFDIEKLARYHGKIIGMGGTYWGYIVDI